MPVAGTNLRAVRCEVVEGVLRLGTRSYFPAEHVERSVEQAIIRLDAGFVVWLHDYGPNAVEVERAFEGEGD